VTPRLYLDEDVNPELARILRTLGYDVTSVHEAGTREQSDDEQLARAADEGRAILTFNYADFLELGRAWFLAGRPHAGIVVSFHQYSRRELGELLRAVLSLLNAVSAEELRDTIRILDQFRGTPNGSPATIR
jgi:predicted nuclease of predicted toxin-antitoxin system